MSVPAVGLFSRTKEPTDRGEDPSPDELTAKAEAMRLEGKLEKALRCCDQALLAEPGNETALAEKAQVLTKMERYQEAMEFFDRVLGQDSAYASDPITHMGRYTALVKLGRMDEALESCNKALRIVLDRRTSPGGGQGSELVLGVLGWYRDQLFRDKAMILNHLGRYAEALEWCDRVLSWIPGDLSALNYKGHALYGLGRYKKAFEVTETAIDYDPSYLPVFILRSQALYRLGEGKRALGIIKDVLKIEPDNEDAIRVQKTIREGTD